MYNLKNILVTTDLSELSAAALEHTVAIASLTGATVHVMYVIESVPRYSVPAAEEESEKLLQDRGAMATKEMQEYLSGHDMKYKPLEVVIRRGHPYQEIVRYAREVPIDLIVIATHGRTGLAHIVMGSIAEKVVRYSPIPVLTVKPRALVERLITQEDVELDLHIHTT